MPFFTKLAVKWIKRQPRAEQLSIIAAIAGGDCGVMIAPNDRPWHTEWPEGMTNAFVSNARIKINHNYSPPRTEFGPA